MICARLLVVILLQPLVLFGAQQPKIKRTKSDFRAAMIARQQLKLARENNILIAKNNTALAQLLEAMARANVLAAEQVKATQEQNRIHAALVAQQQAAYHFDDLKSEPSSPSSSACQTPAPSLSRSMSRNAHHSLAAAAYEAGRIAMMAPAARSSRSLLSASTPDLQSLDSHESRRRKGRSEPSLPTVFSPVNAQAAPEGAISVSASALGSATFSSPDSSVVIAQANAQPQGNGASAAAAAGAALKIQVIPVKDE